MTLATFLEHIDLNYYSVGLAVLRAILFIIAGFFLGKLASHAVGRLYERQSRAPYSLLIRKIIFYIIFVVFLISAARELGLDLRILLGATGILTVAIGFASQTSASNFISGLFLLGEHAMEVGDTITINGTTGKILSIDLFSVKLRQADNTLVRIPNEIIIKNQLVNLTRFPERRYECLFTVPVDTNIELLKTALFKSLNAESLCLTSPLPALNIINLTSSGINLQLLCFAKQADYTALGYRVQAIVLETLRALRVDFTDTTYNIRMLGEKNS